METNQTNPIQSADRIFSITEALAENGSMRIIELSELLGLHKSTVHRLLASLISMGYVNKNESTGMYSLTFKLVELSQKILKNTDILNIAHPYIAKLGDICGETVHFVLRTGNCVTYLEKLESPSVKERSFRLSSQVGLKRPMYCSGVGKAIMSCLSDEEVEQIWSSSAIERRTQYTITDFRVFKKELERVRINGYAIDNEENELGIRCIAAPVYDYSSRPLYAISISTLAGRMPDSVIPRFAEELLKTAGELSMVLGYDHRTKQ